VITKEKALTADRFHVGECTKVVGKRGGVKINIAECRRNGKTQLWVTRPDHFCVPVKRGLWIYHSR
jgi:hypothetical protein